MKKFLGVLILGLIFCTKTFSADVTEQLLKLEDMYQQGSITEEKFLKAKSILLKIDLTNKKKNEQIKKLEFKVRKFKPKTKKFFNKHKK